MDIKHGSKTPHNQITVTRKPEMFMEKKTQNQEKNSLESIALMIYLLRIVAIYITYKTL